MRPVKVAVVFVVVVARALFEALYILYERIGIPPSEDGADQERVAVVGVVEVEVIAGDVATVE